jgi:UDP-N-acetylglucosamine--N-acetylmuramyl-(pentapeptide) pyrophosphoryl-undecaprenol N-acetylglucosamine transferase
VAQVNDAVSGILPWLLERANAIHQCGENRTASVREAAAHLPDVLVLADVVISRSGAGTIAELTAVGKASVLIPLPAFAGDEQRHNARHLAYLGAALALDCDATRTR